MATKHIIKVRLEINISQDHLGLTRVFNELKNIEGNPSGMSESDMKSLKRRYLLSILHQYCAEVPTPTSSDLAGMTLQSKNVKNNNEHTNNSVLATKTPTPVFKLTTVDLSHPISQTVSSSSEFDVVKVSAESLTGGGYLFTEPIS